MIAIKRLAGIFNWGDPTLLQELTVGFPLLGTLQPGSWSWPAHPISRSQLQRLNEEYIQTKLQKHKCDPHWNTMLQEIANDVKSNRMEGPFKKPNSWRCKTVAAPQFQHTQELQPGPSEHPITSAAFSITQTGADGREKVRRGEDWRRGHQNDTIQATDAPVNHRPITFTAIASALAGQHKTSLVSGTDQDDAYRQLPSGRAQ